jgi:hypothetical protein
VIDVVVESLAIGGGENGRDYHVFILEFLATPAGNGVRVEARVNERDELRMPYHPLLQASQTGINSATWTSPSPYIKHSPTLVATGHLSLLIPLVDSETSMLDVVDFVELVKECEFLTNKVGRSNQPCESVGVWGGEIGDGLGAGRVVNVLAVFGEHGREKGRGGREGRGGSGAAGEGDTRESQLEVCDSGRGALCRTYTNGVARRRGEGRGVGQVMKRGGRSEGSEWDVEDVCRSYRGGWRALWRPRWKTEGKRWRREREGRGFERLASFEIAFETAKPERSRMAKDP